MDQFNGGGSHAGDDLRPVDGDGNGKVTVDLDAGASYGLSDIVSYVWTDADGNVVAQGETAQVELDAVKQSLTLTVTDVNGKTATDIVTIDPVSKARVLLSEGFGGGDFSRPGRLSTRANRVVSASTANPRNGSCATARWSSFRASPADS